MIHVENTRLDRSAVIALCKALEHDADRISSINIYPDRVTVTYDHFIVDMPDDTVLVDTVGSPASLP